MRYFWSGLVLLGSWGVSGCAPVERPAQLVLDAENSTIDLGVLDPGEREFVIPFRNGGTVPLQVARVVSTCSCAEAAATSRVGPGESGRLTGKVKVQGGPGGTVLNLTTNAPEDSPPIRVRWFGKSVPRLLISALDVTQKVGVAAMRQVEVSYPAGDPPVPLELVGVDGLPTGMRVQLVQNNPVAIRAIPGVSASLHTAPSPFVGEATLQIDLPTPSKPGKSAYGALIKFSQRGRIIEVPLKVSLQVDEGLRRQPGSLLFSASDPEALTRLRRRAVILSDQPDDQFTVAEKPSYLDVTLKTQTVGATTRGDLSATINAAPPAGEPTPHLVLEDSSGRRVAVDLYIGGGR